METQASIRAEITARSLLREATHTAHMQLESLLRLTSFDLTRAEYGAILRRYAAIYAALERRLEPFALALERVGLDWSAHRKLPSIERDLAALGATSGSSRPPLVTAPLRTFAHAMGCLYVLEGSTLGGLVIARHLATTLQVEANSGASFFDGYGRETSARWKAFCVALELALPDAATRERAIEEANVTFGLFADYVARPSHDLLTA